MARGVRGRREVEISVFRELKMLISGSAKKKIQSTRKTHPRGFRNRLKNDTPNKASPTPSPAGELCAENCVLFGNENPKLQCQIIAKLFLAGIEHKSLSSQTGGRGLFRGVAKAKSKAWGVARRKAPWTQQAAFIGNDHFWNHTSHPEQIAFLSAGKPTPAYHPEISA